MRPASRRRRLRRATATVETAVVLPVYLLLLLAISEFGHAQMVSNLLASACRNAARIGSTEGTTSSNRIRRAAGAPADDKNATQWSAATKPAK